MGYSKNSKGYRIYFPGYKKIDITSDVTFDEDLAYNKCRKLLENYLLKTLKNQKFLGSKIQ